MAPGRKRCVRRESSVRQMDTHDPDIERDTPLDASSAETHTSSSTLRPRGPSVGKGTMALVEKMGNTTGSRSFVAHRHTLCDEETGTEGDPIDFFRDTRCKNGVWVNQAAEETHAQMEELRQRDTQEDGTQAMPSAQIVENVLGYRPGYVKGLGHGSKPTCSDSTMHSTGRTSMDKKLKAQFEELAAKNKKLKEKFMRQEHEISELRTFLCTICAQQGWDVPPFVRGIGPGTSSTTSQPHDPSSHQPSGH